MSAQLGLNTILPDFNQATQTSSDSHQRAVAAIFWLLAERGHKFRTRNANLNGQSVNAEVSAKQDNLVQPEKS